MATKIPKRCEGCNSYKIRCISYIGGISKAPFHQLFRDRFCPCATCLVKPACRDPKYQQMGFAGRRRKHKCQKFYEAIQEFWIYTAEHNLRITKIKRRKKK
jgi:hypothetical protein